MQIKKLSFLSLIGIAASCGNTDYFLNDFNVGQGTGLVGEWFHIPIYGMAAGALKL